MTASSRTFRQRINDLSISRKLFSAGAVMIVLVTLFAAVIGLGYLSASRTHTVARMFEDGTQHLHYLLRGIHEYLLGDAEGAQPQIATGLGRADEHFNDLLTRYPDAALVDRFREIFMPYWRELHDNSERLIARDRVLTGTVLQQVQRFQELGHTAAETLQALRDQAYKRADETNQRTAWTTVTVIGLLLVAVGAVFIWLYRGIAARLVRMNNTISQMEKTNDLSVRLQDDYHDEIGHLAQTCNNLAATTQNTMARVRQEKEDLNDMVEIILQVVDSAARGDLTQFLMEFHGGKSVDHLANGVRKMIDNLNSLIADVRESGFQVAQSTSEIASSSVQQEATSNELAATSNQISASASEIAATSRELVNSMNEVFGVMVAASGAAEDGHDGLEAMEQTMRDMVGAVEGISTKLETLNEKAGNINMVVSTITKVADQTNLLSLNAAIEAEKAGEYGRGFSVVATEIRRLADQTAVSTWDIEQIVKEIQSATSASVMAMEKVSGEIHKGVNNVTAVGEQLSEIIAKVQAVMPGFESVKDSIHAQSEGAGQISESIRQMNESVQETAESLRRSNTAISRLKDAVQVLNNGVARFNIN